VAYGYEAKSHYYLNKSLYIHSPQPELGAAENLLYMIRPDNSYTKTEAEILDLSLVLHAEHGGGNNSAFVTHVVSSTGTDTYSAIAAAVGSLKGPRHGGANIKVIEMMKDLKNNIKDWNDEAEIKAYLFKILKKEAFDKSGLIYGIGHAIYSISDPRALLLKVKAGDLAKEKGRYEEYKLYELVEKLSIQVLNEYRNDTTPICANVDYYSGFVYNMLNIPSELYTPIFAVARIVGWCAHRIEELISAQKIIRPAYKSVAERKSYKPINDRD
jgi:citrate synthase